VSQAVFLVMALLSAAAPDEAQRAALSAYEHTRHVRLEPANADASAATSASKPSAYSPYDGALVGELEAELEAARTAAASLDEPRALELLSRFETRLRAHPELPQSAWLLALRLRLGADIAGRTDEKRAAAERERALVLEGPRALEFGAAPHEQRGAAELTVRIEGLDPRDELELDGRTLASRQPQLARGEHHVRVLRGGRLLFAGWVTLGEQASALVLRVPPIEPCSSDDFDGYRVEAGRALAAPGTRCARWVLAAPARRGLRLADCFGDRCGPFVTYVADAPRSALAPQPDRPRPSRALAGAALVGAAVLAGTGIVLWQSGAFEGDEPARSRWVYGGVSPAE
jgi:hypothetical protein